MGDDYFLSSGDKIRFFLEDDAFDADGKINRPKELAVNKMGHGKTPLPFNNQLILKGLMRTLGLHELDPLFRTVTLENPRLRQLAKEIDFHRDPRVLQSMVIFKQPSIGGQVPEHNDSTFLVRSLYSSFIFPSNLVGCSQYTDPPSALGFWFALEQCTPENGALSFLPGSHLVTPIKKRFVRLPEGGTGFEALPVPDNLPPSSISSEYKQEPCEAGERSSKSSKYMSTKLILSNAGTLVLIHGSVLHKSEKNTSLKTRYAYTFHMIEGDATYDHKNWLQPTPELPFSKLFASNSTTTAPTAVPTNA